MTTSKPIRELLYGLPIPTSDDTLYRDLDIEKIMMIDANNNVCDIDDVADDVINTDNVIRVISLFDKLAIRGMVGPILLWKITPKLGLPAVAIINHPLTCNELRDLYAHTDAYAPLHNNDDPIVVTNALSDAIYNGLCVKNIVIDDLQDGYVTMSDIECCRSITELKIMDLGSQITTCAPLASTLRKLVIACPCNMGDVGVRYCTAIEILDASDNIRITSCLPFAKSLRQLVARGACGIGDGTLFSCTGLTELDASGNCRITTCEAFAKSLKILYANKYECGITDDGLSLCTMIEKLSANNNENITTCEPFADTLKVLYATASKEHGYDNCCGITDNGLYWCTDIEELHADGNKKITTCERYADTLKILSASGACGISDIGLRSCTNINKLNANGNSKITTYAPFAKSICVLNARENSGICDKGLSQYSSITYLNANNNPKVTTCVSFSRTLRVLFASCDTLLDTNNSLCGINDAALKSCRCIEILWASYNPNITTCAPFAKSLKILYAGYSCGICDEGLRPCNSLTYIDIRDNNKITDMRYLRAHNKHIQILGEKIPEEKFEFIPY